VARTSNGSTRHGHGAPETVETTRAQFLAYAGAGLVVLAGARTGGLRLGADRAAAATTPLPADTVLSFATQPTLKPPRVTVVRPAQGVGRGHLFLAPSSGPGQRGVMILDDAGEVVWFRSTAPNTAMDFRAGMYRGKPVLSWWEGKHVKGVGKVGDYVIVDRSYKEVARFKAGRGLPPDFHEFLLTPKGTALVTVYHPVAANLSSVGGPRRGRALEGVVQELDVATGRVVFEWRSLEHVAVADSYITEVGNPFDYFHVNSVGVDHDGHLLVSSRNTWAVYKVHRASGRVIWRLGGKKSDFKMGKGTRFAYQHHARTHDNGRLMSIFDNGPHPGVKPSSRALLLALDTKKRTARLEREFTHSPSLFARVTGSAQRLANGNYLVCWGSTGQFTEFAADGAVRFDAKLPDGGQNYRVFRFPWVGLPTDAPRLAALEGALYASWNGATEVASWSVMTGSSDSNLQATGQVPRTGFETQLQPPAGARYAAAVALDRSSKPLGRSNVVTL
jgi:hypothetical protein